MRPEDHRRLQIDQPGQGDGMPALQEELRITARRGLARVGAVKADHGAFGYHVEHRGGRAVEHQRADFGGQRSRVLDPRLAQAVADLLLERGDAGIGHARPMPSARRQVERNPAA